jgi:hypothetical protein
MKRVKIAGPLAGMALALCFCGASTAAQNSVADDAAAARKPAPTRSIDHPTGATETGIERSLPGDMTSTPTPAKERQRGNTPPGKDREGQGPASGAIVDPTGAVTTPKPY